MSLHDELLDTARYLARRNQNRPTQGDLRRSISTAYYAVFHRLILDSVERLVTPVVGRHTLARAYGHSEMKNVCRSWLQPSLPPKLAALVAAPVPPEIKTLASTFIDLQELRHLADYAPGENYDRSEALNAVGRAEIALAEWERIRETPIAATFLLTLLLGERGLGRA